MTNFPSIGYTDYHAHSKLRARFGRALPRQPLLTLAHSDQSEWRDEAILALLLDTAIGFNSEEHRFRQYYERERVANPNVGLPTFEEGINRGWFRIVAKHVFIPRALREFLSQTRPAYEVLLLDIVTWSWNVSFTVAHPNDHGEVYDLVQRLQAAGADNCNICVRSPEWVAARLWDRPTQRDLQQWVIKWRLLGGPNIVPSVVWQPAVAREFCDIAIKAAAAAGLSTWGDACDSWKWRRLQTAGDIRTEESVDVDLVPEHLLGKFMMTQGPAYADDDGDTGSDLMEPLAMVATDLARRTHGPLPYPETRPLLELATNHPSVLGMLCHRTTMEPELLADFLMEPASAALATYLVASWRPAARDESEADVGDREQRFAAFEDAVLAVGDLLANSALGADETAELLIGLQRMTDVIAPAAAELAARRVNRFLKQLRQAPDDTLTGIAQALMARTRQGAGTPEFAVLLALLAATPQRIVQSLATRITEVYRESIQPGAYLWDVEPISAGSARVLMEAILSLGDAGQAFLCKPIDVRASLAAAEPSAASNIERSITQSLRTHIRLLARAISAFEDGVPSTLVDALAAAIRMGSLRHAEKGKVPAFSGYPDALRFYGRRQRPIGVELADAINRISPAADQQKIVDALLQIDEPGVLAALYTRLPLRFRAEIERRITELEPGEAGEAATLTEIHDTIQELLSAGLHNAAAKFMVYEETIKTMGKAPGREIERFRMRLHAKLLQGDYSGILAAAPPTGLTQHENERAIQAFNFYKGLALLQRGNSNDAAEAAAIFEALNAKHPSPAHAINLFAARLNKALPHNIFAKLTGDAADMARLALDEANKALSPATLPPEQVAIHNANKAALQLALGRTSAALESIRVIPPTYVSAESSAFEAVAVAREGLPDDAIVILKKAQLRFGPTEILKGAEGHIKTGAEFLAHARLVDAEVLISGLRDAFYQFATLGAEEQARVRVSGVGQGALGHLLTLAVREALASVANLVPFLKLNDPGLHEEDDINSLLREVLNAQLSLWYGWSVVDQSKGGVTPKGRPGERDLVIKQRNSELAVIEALKYSTSGRSGTKSHFAKLPAYANCDMFFHVTYSHSNNPGDLVTYLEGVAKSPPLGLTYVNHEPIAAVGTQPAGLTATYEGADRRRITVVFLLVDLLQGRQRLAVGAPGVTPTTLPSTSAAPPPASMPPPNSSS